MAIEPPFGDFTDPDDGRNVHGIPTWIVEEVNSEIRDYYDDNPGSPTLSDADEYYFVWGEQILPADHPPIYQLPKSYCVYVLECEWKGFDKFSSFQHVKRMLQNRAESLGYEYSDEWMKAIYYSGPPRYVGLSTNPYARIHEHTRLREHTNTPEGYNPSGARFTAMFPPYAVQRIEWVNDKQTAERVEQETANELHDENNCFVYPRPAD